jgi:hypothetical protein
VKFAPNVKKLSHTHQGHVFEVSAEDFELYLKSAIPWVPGWAASVVKLGGAVPAATGGLLDGKLTWPGYRWMRQRGVKHQYHDGRAWKDLPAGFVLDDGNNFCVGFYASGGHFVCQYGGNWPDAFRDWDPEAPAKKRKIETWERTIDSTWTHKLDLKRKECQSAAHACCRYPITARVKFAKQAAFRNDVIILADGNIRSNASLFFLGDPDAVMAAHEFGHHIGNPDEYAGADLETTLNDDGAVNGIDNDSIMGQDMTKVKKRHFRMVAKVSAQAVQADLGKGWTYEAVPR